MRITRHTTQKARTGGVHVNLSISITTAARVLACKTLHGPQSGNVEKWWQATAGDVTQQCSARRRNDRYCASICQLQQRPSTGNIIPNLSGFAQSYLGTTRSRDEIEWGADCDKHGKYIVPNVSYTHFPSKIKQYGSNLCSKHPLSSLVVFQHGDLNLRPSHRQEPGPIFLTKEKQPE